MMRNLHYPKPNMDSFYKAYEFEIALVENILNGKVNKSLNLYEDFFSRNFLQNIIESDPLQYTKCYVLSLSLLVCHSIIKKGVSPYSAKAKYNAFSNLIIKTMTVPEVINIGKEMIHGYTRQLMKNSNAIENIYIRNAIDYIHDNLGEELTLDMVSDHVGLSKCYFCTQFKKETNMSFTAYLTYVRIEKSKYLLSNTDQSILDIAILMGFNSQGYFTTQFKKHTGVSPKEFKDGRMKHNYVL